jgi:hypothetical protein
MKKATQIFKVLFHKNAAQHLTRIIVFTLTRLSSIICYFDRGTTSVWDLVTYFTPQRGEKTT